jgi:soluble lytic murein transglycosylase
MGDGLQAGGCYTGGMRVLLILLLCFSSFAASAQPAAPASAQPAAPASAQPAAPAFAQPAAPSQAASPQIMEDVKSGNWNDALALAQATGDPLVIKLVVFFQLLGGGDADAIEGFIGSSPDWPEQATLALRLAQANGTYVADFGPAQVPFLAQVQSLHADGNDRAAAALWMAQGKAAAAAATPNAQLLFWPAQDELARALLAAGDARHAYQVVIAVDPPIAGATARGQLADRDFLAGFLLLRFLKQPAEAATWFTDLASSSTAVITQARAYYWRARTEAGAAAQADYNVAAGYPDTYYGQLAALALGDTPGGLAARILAAPEPAYTADDALDFALMELPRAAFLLTQMQDPQDARIFLNRLGQICALQRYRELAAKLALGLGYPQTAVAIARTAGIAGQMLIREGWPMPITPPAGLEPAIAFGIMRQESSFDPSAVSGAGALGLMQLMPETARRTAAQNGIAYRGADDLTDPQINMALGGAYITGLIQDFGNCLPLAIAAYNAGPTNVANWLAENGDPEMGTAAGGADMVDWVEEIPFGETRNYVQRVTESIVIYRALQTGQADSPLKPWLQS